MREPSPTFEERGPSLEERLGALPGLTPKQVDERLLTLGYRGQRHARRAASVLAYRHIRRLHRLNVEKVSPADLPPRDNYLFIGPTGSGKTFLVELLFRDLLKVPTVIVDITQYSETGYIGEDVNMILSRLFEAAGQDVGWAACGHPALATCTEADGTALGCDGSSTLLHCTGGRRMGGPCADGQTCRQTGNRA